jgi:hypothetical protein
MFPDGQKYFRTYNYFSENTVVFQFTFSCPENYLNYLENLLKLYINLSALENLPEIPHEQLSWCCSRSK